MRNPIFRRKRIDHRPPAKLSKPKVRRVRQQFRFNRAERIALLANGIIWTLIVWTALIFALLQDGQLLWQWLLKGPISAQVVPPAGPNSNLTDWQAPGPTATANPSPTPTRVILEPVAHPETSSPTPLPPLEPTPGPTLTAPPTTTPASAQAEEAAIVLPQPVGKATSLQTGPPPASPAEAAARTPTRLIIPSVGLDATIVPVGWETTEQDGQWLKVWQVADDAVGWHQNSALPGQSGNIVLSGHSNIGGEIFRHLANVKEGDSIVVMVGNTSFEYKISLTTIVKEAGEPLATRVQNARWIAPTDDERLTLVTCWPYPYSTHRFIAVATPL